MCAIQRGRSQKPPYSVAEGIGEEANPPGSWSASSTAQRRCRRSISSTSPHLEVGLGSFSVGWRRPAPGCPGLPPRRQGPNEAIKGEKKKRQGGRESGARCLPPRLVPTRALRQEGGFPTRTQRPSPIPHGPAMNPGQREHRRRELLDRRISPPLEESRRWAWWAETPVLVDAKPGGSPYVHCESTGKSGGSLREGRKFAAAPLREFRPRC